jgi:hypothetical protein
MWNCREDVLESDRTVVLRRQHRIPAGTTLELAQTDCANSKHRRRHRHVRMSLRNQPGRRAAIIIPGGLAMHAYIVRTRDGYLYPFAGDASLTDDPDQAGHFLSTEEACRIASERGYYDGQFDVLRVEVGEQRLNRHWEQ